MDSRDITALERCMRQPDWEMPEDFQKDLPKRLMDYIAEGEEGKMTRGRLRAIEIIRKMHEGNRKQAPPPQEVNLNVTGDFAQAVAAVQELSPEEQATLAAADRIMESKEGGGDAQADGDAGGQDDQLRSGDGGGDRADDGDRSGEGAATNDKRPQLSGSD